MAAGFRACRLAVGLFLILLAVNLPLLAYSQSSPSVNTDKTSYTFGETVIVSGNVNQPPTGAQALIRVLDPKGVTVRNDSVAVASDGSFTYSFKVGGSGIDGTYTVVVTYNSASADTTFAYASITGTITINSDATYTKSTAVSLTITCTSISSNCDKIRMTFQNADANTSSTKDSIKDIKITGPSSTAKVTAIETGLNTGIFNFTFDNSDEQIDTIQGVNFKDGDNLTVSNIQLDSKNGVKSVTATFYDLVNNQASRTDTITLDTVAPAAPTITSPKTGASINNTTPSIAGTAESNTAVEVLIDGLKVSGTITGGTSWAFMPSQALAEGSHTITATATDLAGNTSPLSLPVDIIVTSTTTSTITVQTDKSSITSNTESTTISGKVTGIVPDQGVMLQLTRPDGSDLFPQPMAIEQFGGNLNADTGNYAMPPSQFTDVGTWTVMVTYNDASAQTTFVVTAVSTTNKYAPAAVAGPDQTVTSGQLVTLDGTGSYDGDAGTVLTYKWTQTAGPAVTLSSPTSSKPTFTAPAVDKETILTFRLMVNDGQYDANEPGFVSITVDTSALAGTVDINSGDAYTTSYSVTLALSCSGCIEMAVAVDGNPDSEVFEPFNKIKRLTLPKGDGTKTVAVIFKDSFGKTFPADDSITLDTTSPAAPVITDPANGVITENSRQIISGTEREKNDSAFVVIFDGQREIGEVLAIGNNWTSDLDLGAGEHLITAKIRDVAGNLSPASNAVKIVVRTGIDPALVIGGGGAAATAAAVTYGVKTGKIKLKIQPKSASWIELELGVEELALPLEGRLAFDPQSVEELARGFHKYLKEIGSELREKMGYVAQVGEFASMVSTIEDPDATATRVSNKFLDEILEKAKPQLSKVFLRAIKAKIEVKGIGQGEKYIKSEIRTDIQSIHPYVGVVVFVGGARTFSARLKFKVDTELHIKKLEVHKVQDRTTISLGAGVISFRIFVVGLSFQPTGKTTSFGPIEIRRMDFVICSGKHGEVHHGAPVLPARRTCEKCGQHALPENEFCTNCGAPLGG